MFVLTVRTVRVRHCHSAMKVAIKCMYRDGEALSAKELGSAPRHTGKLIVEKCLPKLTCRTRQARLLDCQSACDVIPPLVDPELTTFMDNRMLLRGYQISIDLASGVVRQCAQGWIVHLVL